MQDDKDVEDVAGVLGMTVETRLKKPTRCFAGGTQLICHVYLGREGAKTGAAMELRRWEMHVEEEL